ncbi:protein-export membrane protein SecF [Luteibacter rhizovicinus DSM 16549]|jgi:preprotein translocase subunit SecF|uniref:Protein-export membrane protein SecF n=1 Tax=Luteibacter rhizovicinus DSM 16549 TaxID=1440763 RepID=A0A1L3EPC9_9GAMM|nr:protein translocase subunit SecF [Luteibacter rhizovicinus]APG02938.1 protein-export membrane protein SecF [Luteibacter rhizovicinus DSM 16549]KLD76488.1 preprotein translocase subunit SecF [Xanthomonas hyacinthi DSM 19077]
MEIFNHNSNFNFLGLRRFSIGLGILLMIGSISLILTKGFNYGQDFVGGVAVEVEYQAPIDPADVRAALEKSGLENPLVQAVGGTRDFTIRMQPKDDKNSVSLTGDEAAAKVAGDVVAALKVTRPDVIQKSRSFVGPQVGEELRSDGVVAVAFVIIGIMGYLWLRFEWRFALAALATEIHDVLVTLGIFAITQRDFDLTVLASVLAVVGYSINDKVVVFDRVRELFRASRNATPEEVLNRSINSTLSRTIITSLFTGITMAALFFIGGPVVHGFAITMLIGILVGTLSSIFIASPILLWLGVSKKDLMPRSKEDPELERRP